MHIDINYITNTRIWATFNFFPSISAIKSKYQVLNIFNRLDTSPSIHPPPINWNIWEDTYKIKYKIRHFITPMTQPQCLKFSSENVWQKYFAFLFSCELGTGEQTSESHLF